MLFKTKIRATFYVIFCFFKALLRPKSPKQMKEWAILIFFVVITMEMEDKHGNHAVGGVIQTATALVNAISAVVAHSSGMVAAMDLPKITGRGLYKPDA